MANVDNPHGLTPIQPVGSANESGKVVHMYAPADYATAIFIGDRVIKVAAGSNDVVVDVVGGNFQVGTLPEVNLVGVGDTTETTGVVVGFLPTTRDSEVFGAASTVRVLLVNTDPYQEYLIQADGAVPPLTIGLNANCIQTHAGSTTTGISGLELDTTSDPPAADASNPLIIIRMHNAPDNETNLIHNEVIVRVNLSTEAADRAGSLGI